MMNADRLIRRIASAFILILLGILPACASSATPTFYRPPTESSSQAAPLPVPQAGATATEVLPAPTLPPAQPTATPPCTDGLTFLNDLTYPDGTVVLPGATLAKQWLVQNSGACDWDQSYLLKFVGGDQLGAPPEIPLYPARAGARITLSVQFTAPDSPGTYESRWQAVNPDGIEFGDTVYVVVTVAPY